MGFGSAPVYALELFDCSARPTRSLGDLTILRFDDGASRLITVKAAENLTRYAAVRRLRAILVDDVEQDKLSFGRRLLARHQTFSH